MRSGRIKVSVLAAATMFAALPRLGIDLSLDEIGTAWVAQGSMREAIYRSFHIQGQSPFYYLIVWLIRQLCGDSALAMRLFSLACLFAAGLAVASLASKLVGKGTALYAGGSLLLCSQALEFGTQARPYALALALAAAATGSLVSLCDNPSWKRAIGYSALLTATIYAHYLFAQIVPLHAAWILYISSAGDAGSRSRLLSASAAAYTAVAVACIPCIYQLKVLSAKTVELSFGEPFSLEGLLTALVPSDLQILALISGGLALAFRLTIKRGQHLRLAFPGWMPLAFAIGFLMLPPLAIAALSGATEASLFVERYYGARLIGFALIAAILIELCSAYAPPIVIMACFAIVSVSGQRQIASNPRASEGWQEALADASRASRGGCRLMAMTGFIESQRIEWLSIEPMRGFIASPLSFYGAPEPPESALLPYTFETEAAGRYLAEVVGPLINQSSCVKVVYRNVALLVSKQRLNPVWFALKETLGKSGYELRETRRYGLVEAMTFERKA